MLFPSTPHLSQYFSSPNALDIAPAARSSGRVDLFFFLTELRRDVQPMLRAYNVQLRYAFHGLLHRTVDVKWPELREVALMLLADNIPDAANAKLILSVADGLVLDLWAHFGAWPEGGIVLGHRLQLMVTGLGGTADLLRDGQQRIVGANVRIPSQQATDLTIAPECYVDCG